MSFFNFLLKVTMFVCFFYFFNLKNAKSQYTFLCKVIEAQSQQPIERAVAYFPDLHKQLQTNSEGFFELKNLKKGSYLVEISHTGYKTAIQEVLMQKDTTFTLALEEAHTELNAVVVTGTSKATQIKQNPVIVQTLDKKNMNQIAATNLIDALKKLPNIDQVTTGAAVSKPIVRGLGYNRVVVLHNGIRQEGQQWGDEHGVEIDEYAIDKVEIVKGAGSLMYGSDAIGGVLQFIGTKPAPINTIKNEFIANYQTNNNLMGYSLSHIGTSANEVNWGARLSTKMANDYANKYDGKVLNSGFREYNASAFAGVSKNWGYSKVHISSFNAILNLPEGERDSLGNFMYINAQGNEVTATPKDSKGYKVGFPHQKINHFKVANNNFFVLNKGTLRADFAFQNNLRREFAEPTAPNTPELFFDLKTLNYNILYENNFLRNWKTSVGINGMFQKNMNKGEQFLIPNYALFEAGAFGIAQKNLTDKLLFIGGVRYDNRFLNTEALWLNAEGLATTPQKDSTATLKFAVLQKNYSGISGSAGISYQMNKNNTVKLNFSRGYRAPSIPELASNGRHEGTFRYEYGAATLKPEVSHQLDVAYILDDNHFSIQITPFFNNIQNYIFASKLLNTAGFDSIPDPNDPAPAFTFKQGNATLMGGELFFDFHPHPYDWLHFQQSFGGVYAWQHSQPDSTKYLPFIPAPKYNAELKAEFLGLKNSISSFYVKATLSYYFAQNRYFKAYNTETATPAYTLLGAGIGAAFKVWNKKETINLFLSAENLGNVAYQSHTSRLKYAPLNVATNRMGVFNMGRNVSLKMILNF